jgi:hypothetical protein
MQRISPVPEDRAGEQLLIFVDDPGVPAGQPVASLTEPRHVRAAWQQAAGDRRFALFGAVAVDKAKVCAVDGKTGSLRFDLGQGRGVALALGADLASSILSTIPEPKAGVVHLDA